MDYHLNKKQKEMKELMNRFIKTNKEHQELMNENIMLCSKIRQKKKHDIKKIKIAQKTKFNKKVNKIKSTILEQSKFGKDGEAIISGSVLNQFTTESVVHETPEQSVNENFFSKIGKSIMVLGKSNSKNSQRSLNKSSNFKKKSNDISLSKRSIRDESQIIQKKDYRIPEISPLRIKPKTKTQNRNFSDDSSHSKSPDNITSIKNTKKNIFKDNSRKSRYENSNKIKIKNESKILLKILINRSKESWIVKISF